MKLIIKFYSPEENGRDQLPDLSSGLYRPHLVVDGCPKDEYLGVQFISSSSPIEFNTDIQTTVKLPYNEIDYSPLSSGVTFIIKEGSKTVGTGCVENL